jgi:GT2 family glycosyltransferase
LGGLDEAYFMYMEDIDLSLRARLLGATCLAGCDAVAEHNWSLALTPRKFGLLERNRRRLWTRFVGPSDGLWLVFVQAEAMAWGYAAIHGRRYLKAKWNARRGTLAVDANPASRTLRPWLSKRHPYDVLFPGSKVIAAAGMIADTIVSYGVIAAMKVGRRRSLAFGCDDAKSNL